MRILDTHRAALDAQYLVRSISELEYIPLQAFNREVLVDGADHNRLRLEHHPVIGVIRYGAAGSDRRQARALTGPQDLVHRIVMQQRAAAAAPRAESLRQ